MTYQQIKSFINTYIVPNGVNAITGAQLNTVLNALADYYGFDSVVVTNLPAGSQATATVTNRTLNLGIPAGQNGRDGDDAINPFKGWWPDLATLKAAYTATPGDYAFVRKSELPVSFTIGKLIDYGNGVAKTSGTMSYSSYVDVEGLSQIAYTRIKSSGSTSLAGMAFYSTNDVSGYMSGERCVLDADVSTGFYEESIIAVPPGAKYARFSMYTEYVGEFYVRNTNSLSTGIFVYDETESANEYWKESGLMVNESIVQSFLTGQALNTVSIINDLLTGGVNNVLSAEQGKILAGIVSNILSNLVLYDDLDYSEEAGGGINYSTGNIVPGSQLHTNYIDIQGYLSLRYSKLRTSSTTTNVGIAFYDAEYQYLEGQRCITGADTSDGVLYVETDYVIPPDAKYVRLTIWPAPTPGFFVSATKNEMLDQDKIKEIAENQVPATVLKGKKVSIIGDSISCFGNETQTRTQGYNAPYWIVKSVDVGVQIQSWVTWLDVYTSTSGTTPTNKTIGGVTLTAAMIGTMQTFTPVLEDVGKAIGVARWAANYTDKPWWQVLIEKSGAELCNNASWSGSAICKVKSPERVAEFVLSEAYSDYTIGRLAKRDDNGVVITPDVVIIYRGTNDFVYKDADENHETIDTPNMMTWTDITDEMNMTQCYIKTIEKIRAAYPNAYIILCTLNVFKQVNYSHYPTNNGVNTLPQYSDKIREIANLMGCGLIEFDKDGITFENCYPTYINDNATTPLHPNTRGHKVMGEKAFADIKYVFNK